jgi:hypothetical protein
MPTREAPPSPVSDPSKPPDHGPGVTFLRSSQARHWHFSASKIEEMRSQGNEAACKRLREIWSRERVSEVYAFLHQSPSGLTILART